MPAFLRRRDDAKAIIAHQITVIRERFQSVYDEAELTAADRSCYGGGSFLIRLRFMGCWRGWRWRIESIFERAFPYKGVLHAGLNCLRERTFLRKAASESA